MTHDYSPFSDLPERIRGLGRLAYNLWWTWHRTGRDLFHALGPATWRASSENPIRMLSLLSPEALTQAANDQRFLARYDAAMADFTADTDDKVGWFTDTYGLPPSPLAFFATEFGLHHSLPANPGGLALFAGDFLKEASDLAIPVVGVGLHNSRQVTQRIREDGWPQDAVTLHDNNFAPLTRVVDDHGHLLTVEIRLFDSPVHVAVWKVEVGRVPLYLLDTDLPINQPWDRAVTQCFYACTPEQRLRQAIIFGIGGMRVLEELGIEPSAIHLNEGISALAGFERLRCKVHQGASFEEALERVRTSTVFTTHQTATEGSDVFSVQLVEKHLARACDDAGIDRDAFFQLGVDPKKASTDFDMTLFALRTSGFRNTVSRQHAQIARSSWAALWPERQEDDVPIASITHGVHLPSWIDSEQLQPLLDQTLGPAWLDEQDRSNRWTTVSQIPDGDLWHLHRAHKIALIAEMKSRARARWQYDRAPAENIIAFGALLSTNILTLGFGPRFCATYRPDLVLSDLARLKRLLTDAKRPIQIIFAGSTQPSDNEEKRLLQRVFLLAEDPACAGRIAFVENYDQRVAELMTQGVDVWLTPPLPRSQACDTNGMKSSINGVPVLGSLAGWWNEGFSSANGWAFGDDVSAKGSSASDATALYELIEKKLVPLFYQRASDGIPHGFVEVMKAAIASVAPNFSATRMVKEYASHFYVPALGLHVNGQLPEAQLSGART